MGIIDPKAARRLKELGPKIQVTLEEFVSCDKQVIWNTSVWNQEVKDKTEGFWWIAAVDYEEVRLEEGIGQQIEDASRLLKLIPECLAVCGMVTKTRGMQALRQALRIQWFSEYQEEWIQFRVDHLEWERQHGFKDEAETSKEENLARARREAATLDHRWTTGIVRPNILEHSDRSESEKCCIRSEIAQLRREESIQLRKHEEEEVRKEEVLEENAVQVGIETPSISNPFIGSSPDS